MVIGRISTNDMEMMAVDLSEAIDRARQEYASDLPEVDPADVLAALPGFLAALQVRVEERS